jgi:predicted transcriptional regulator
MEIEYFGNDKYRFWACMSDRQIFVKDIFVVKLSQQEIADIVQLSKAKVSGIISELKYNGYITQNSPRGKYSLTNKAYKVLAILQNRKNEE